MMRPLIAIFILIIGSGVVAGTGDIVLPIPEDIKVNRPLARIGKALFFDPTLSRDGTVSCASCHDPYSGGDDSRPVSIGVGGQKGTMNAPTVLNAVFNFRQFWNGRAHGLKEQAIGPILNPVEMGLDSQTLEQKVNGNVRYRILFKEVLGSGEISTEEIVRAIVEYEKTLITPNAKFDRFLKGEVTLAPDEQRGYRRFRAIGCINCHNGVNLGGNSYQKIGIIFPLKRAANVADRFAITAREEDKHVFKVPTLRNVELTAPYFHDGSIETLDEAVRQMALLNLGRTMNTADVKDVVAFLKTLTGVLPEVAR